MKKEGNKLRVGILTFHRAYNYGAFLQSFASSREMSKHGHQTEIIDFTPSSLMDGYKPIKIFENRMIETNHPIIFYIKNVIYKIVNYGYINKKNLFELVRNQSIWEDMDKIPLSEKCFISDQRDIFNQYFGEKYDLIVVGSDAIWNDYQIKCPYIYYLENTKCRYKVSYAASAYGMSYERKSSEQLAHISELLEDFDLIACRDEYTENEVRKISKKSVYHTCDPTFFLNASDFDEYAESAKEKLINAGVDFSKKLVFLMGDANVGKVARAALSDQYALIGIYNYNRYADINIPNLTPFEWAASFRFFEFTITSYFHCSIFSLLSGIPVVAIDKITAFSIKHKSKIRDLFERLHITDFYHTSDLSKIEMQKASVAAVEKRNDSIWKKELHDSIINERETGNVFLRKIDSLNN